MIHLMDEVVDEGVRGIRVADRVHDGQLACAAEVVDGRYDAIEGNARGARQGHGGEDECEQHGGVPVHGTAADSSADSRPE